MTDLAATPGTNIVALAGALALVVVVLVGAAIYLATRRAARRRLRRIKSALRAAARATPAAAPRPATAPDLRCETIALLDPAASRMFAVIEAALRDFGAGHRLMMHTAMAAAVRPVADAHNHDAAAAALLTLSLEFAVFDRSGHLVAAIEFARATAPRTHAHAMKRDMLAAAGVAYLAAAPDFDTAELRAWLKPLLQPPAARSA